MTAASTPRPVERETGGVSWTDRWQHLEEDAPEVLQWQADRDAEARDCLSGPSYDALRTQVAAVLTDTRLYAPERRGDQWFGLVLPAGAQQPVLQVSEGPGGKGRVLVDPAALSAAAGAPVSLDFAFPSPDGRRVAYGVSTAGDEAAVVHVVDVGSGKVLDDRVPLAMASAIAWEPGGDGFYVADVDPSATALQLRLLHHTVGGKTVVVPDQPAYRHPVVMPQLSPDGRLLAAVVDHLAPRPDHLLDVATGVWRPFLIGAEGALQGGFVGDSWVAVATHGAPRGRVVRVPLDDASRHEELVPETATVLRHLAVAGTAAEPLLVLSGLRDAAAHITVHAPDGALVSTLRLPGPGSAAPAAMGYNLPCSPMTTAGPSLLAATVFTSHTTSAAVLVADLLTGHVEVVTPPAVTLDGLVSETFAARSADGTEVPYTVVRQAGATGAALLYGYGGFNVAFTPGFLEQFTPVVDAGGLVVHCQLRGGGEYGTDWWSAGRLAQKQHTFDDLYAVAEDLVALGLADAGRLACFGGSNGGLLTAVAGVQRPELWAAVVSDRPVLDLLGCVRDPYTLAAVAADYGMPLSPADAPGMAAWSPYQNVDEGITYPPTLVIAGANDPRCPAWHARKHVARLQEVGAPALLRVWADAGHLGMDADAAVAKNAEWLSFVLAHLGLSSG